MKLIDTHCHLADKRLCRQMADVLEHARTAGVLAMICSASDIPDSQAAARIAASSEAVYFTAGVHPHEAKNVSPGYLDELAALAGQPRNVAVGEIGLDYHYDFSPRDMQRKVFAEQLDLALHLGKPIVIHTREAFADTMAILDERRPAWDKIVFHSFTGGPDEARVLVERGCYVSFSGILTFKTAEDLRRSAQLISADRVLTETDAPYLTPEPMRHIKTNEPAYVAHVLARLASLRGLPVEDLAQQVWDNAHRLFGLAT